MTDLELWYDRPAATWTEALPLGNGRLGAMVFGDVSRERLQLNESTFFTGGPYTPVNPDAREHLAEIRELIFARRFAEAEAVAHRHMMARPYLQTSFQPIGDVWINFHHAMTVDAYRRSLDLDSAVATTTYVSAGVRYTRRVFVSPVAGVLVYRITADRPRAVNIDIGLSSPQPGDAEPARADTLGYAGRNRREQGINGALRFNFGVKARADGGYLSAGPETLRIQHADGATIFVDAATSFRRFDDVDGDPAGDVETRLAAAAQVSDDELLAEHLREHRRLFRTLALDLGSTPEAAAPTDARVARYGAGRDPALVTLFAQFGRYLAISSSRPGTQPANLQGLWNEEIRPSWGSKYTTNINLEMNYWLPDPANLRECFEPLIALVEDVAETGRTMAETHYGARGWVLHHNTDLWRATGPVDGPQWGLWPMGGAWLCAQLWDHYQFWPEHNLLARIYPLMRGAVEFLLDYLVEDPNSGALVTNPSLSPENQHPFGAALCAGPAMDNQIMRDLFGGLIESAERLGRDPDLVARVREVMPRLAPDRIGKAGQLQEWAEDWDAEVPEPHHRHVSHLYGLYPSWQIALRTTPELAAAARRSLEIRGDDATGWGIGWRLNLWARLGDGERAATILLRLLSPDRTYPNLFDAHPPFQIDGNFGGAAGVIEMLVQSRRGWLELLPALPPDWPVGRIDGVRARGGIELGCTWADGMLQTAYFVASADGPCLLAYGDAQLQLSLKSGERTVILFRDGALGVAPPGTTA